MPLTVRKEMVELADDLAMFVGQLDDAIRDTANAPPSPWQLDTWLDRYRDWYKNAQ